MAISAKDVMGLRKRTGLGMMECKAALAEVDGDVEAAIALLRERLGKKMEERSDREAAEGVVAVATNASGAVIIELASETDFTAKNDSFREGAQKIADIAVETESEGSIEANDAINEIIEGLRITIKENISLKRAEKINGSKLGAYVHHNGRLGVVIAGEGDLSDDLLTGICQHITAAVPPMMPAPIAIDESGLPADQVESQTNAFIEEAKATGKPAEIAEKIAGGKLRKWKDDNTLLGQVYIREMDAKKPIRDYVPSDATINGYLRYEIGA